jgi:SOS-response transcriptional repressor LexA
MITGPGWATPYIAKLKQDGKVQLKVYGTAMIPLLAPGDQVILRIITNNEVYPGDIVLCRVNGRDYLHKIASVRLDRYQIADNKDFIKGWVTLSGIFGKCVKIIKREPAPAKPKQPGTSTK